MSKIECKDIDYILAIAKHGNISKAADELFVSQPALTKYLKHLEERLDVELFVHGKRPLTLTTAGEMYMDYAKEIAALKNNLENELIKIKRNDYELLRVGFACTGVRQHVYTSVNRMRREDVNAKIIMTELTSEEIEKKLLSNQIDIGFITLPPRSDEIESHLIMEEDLLLAVPARHPLAFLGTPCDSKEFPTINLDRFSGDTFVLRDEGTRFRTYTNTLFEQAGFTPEVATIGRNNFSCMEFAEAWGICCITTQSFITGLKDPDSMRFFIAGPKPQKLSVGIANRKGSMLSTHAGQLVNMISQEISKNQL